ncbi:hypothetical protein [Cryptosporangium sp. NPDC048952]
MIEISSGGETINVDSSPSRSRRAPKRHGIRTGAAVGGIMILF